MKFKKGEQKTSRYLELIRLLLLPTRSGHKCNCKFCQMEDDDGKCPNCEALLRSGASQCHHCDSYSLSNKRAKFHKKEFKEEFPNEKLPKTLFTNEIKKK